MKGAIRLAAIYAVLTVAVLMVSVWTGYRFWILFDLVCLLNFLRGAVTALPGESRNGIASGLAIGFGILLLVHIGAVLVSRLGHFDFWIVLGIGWLALLVNGIVIELEDASSSELAAWLKAVAKLTPINQNEET
jgi:hypothetical protein